MSAARTAGYLLVLTVIGVVAFALFGAIHEARIGRPLAVPVPQTTRDGPAAMMQVGAGHTLGEAARLLDAGRRSEATHAMDAAMRVLEVGAYAFRDISGKQWHEAANRAKKGREALANGDVGRAIEDLRAAAERLGDASARGMGGDAVPELNRYVGATVLNAAGIRIGEIVSVASDGDRATVAIGGVRDLFGFWDWGSRTVRVASDVMVRGRTDWPKPTLVVLATVDTEPAEIVRALQP